MNSPAPAETSPPSTRYATFGSRLVARLVDFVVFLPLTIADTWFGHTSRTVAIVSSVLLQCLAVAYPVVMHARWGQTLGKMAAGIRVVRLSGKAISLREALLRSSVDIVLGVLVTASSIRGMMRMADSDWSGDWLAVGAKVHGQVPDGGTWVVVALQLWVWSEILVILTNRKRRALHDFIAGTVVIA